MRKAYQFLLSWRTLRKQLMKQHTIMTDVGTSLAVQWLRRLAANARGGGSTPSGRTGNLHVPQGGQKIKTKTLWQMYIYTRPSLVAQLVKNHLQCGRPGLDSWVGKISWRRERLPTSVFWPGEFHGLYSLWGRKESDMTEQLSLTIHILILDSQYPLWKRRYCPHSADREMES